MRQTGMEWQLRKRAPVRGDPPVAVQCAQHLQQRVRLSQTARMGWRDKGQITGLRPP